MTITWRDWGTHGRVQTAAMEMGLFPLAAWMGGTPWQWLPFFVVMGLWNHYGAFSNNTISDYLKYDRYDPAKRDTAIVSGRMTPTQGWLLSGSAQLIAGGMFIYMVIVHHTTVAIIPFAGFIGLGYLYNYCGKRNKAGAVVAISLSYGLLNLSIGAVWRGLWLWPLFAWVIALIAFEIGIAGEVKEIGQAREDNLLRRLGTEVVDGNLELSWAAGILGIVLMSLKALTTTHFLAGTPWWWTDMVVFVVGTLLVVYVVKLIESGPYDRPRRMKVMGLGEAGSYLLLVLAVAWTLPLWLTLYLFIGPMTWFVLWNHALYKVRGTSDSVLAPGI